jgi:hypothetical protein
MDSEAPGWDAITAALRSLYDGQKEFHYGTVLPYRLGGRDPLQGISVYRSDGSQPHWHYVTYGFSELWEKESDNADVSGWGIEMTFRLAADKAKKPPAWPLNFLQNLARYVFETGNVLEEHHHLDLNGPIALGQKTAIHAAAFALDPQLPPLSTPNGRVNFVQCVGLTLDELEAIQDWNARGVLDLLARDNPLLVTDLKRKSVLTNPDIADAVRQGIERDGSSTGRINVNKATWRETTRAGKRHLQLTVAAHIVDRLGRYLNGRLPHQRDFVLLGAKKGIIFEPGKRLTWKADDVLLTVKIPDTLVGVVAATVQPVRGVYRFPGHEALSIKVVPAEIKDGDGNVVEVVG